jgi:hypothetical protein
MMSWTRPPVDLGIIRKATPAGRPVILDLDPGVDHQAVHGGDQ